MELDLERVAAVVGRELAFRDLSREQLLIMVERFETIKLQKDQVFAVPRKTLEAYCMIFEGKLELAFPERRKKPVKTIMGPGDYFGEETLFNENPPPVTVTALEDTILLTLAPAVFKDLVELIPEQSETIIKAMKITATSRRAARSIRFKWLNDDESVFFLSRKHYFFLLRSLMLPVLLFVLSFPVVAAGLAGTTDGFPVVLAIGLAMLLFGLFGIFWLWVDWTNDYYIVTNQRVVWVEKIVLLYDSRLESTLLNILATEVSSSLLGRILDFGNVAARTFTGQVPFKGTTQPIVAAAYIDNLRFRAQEVQEELVDKEMEQALAAAIAKKRAAAGKVLVPETRRSRPMMPPKKEPERKPKGLRERFENILKVRYEKNGVITYRKHWFVWVSKSWVPLLIMGLIILATVWSNSGVTGVFTQAWQCIFPILGLFDLLWLLYTFQDWRNDIYQLTPTQIFDIEKKPLGTETKHSADLKNILTVTHVRNNLINIIFNYGNVIVTVGETLFTFMGVFNPDRVHQDIVSYQDAQKMRDQQVEQAREREKMIRWLVTYNTEYSQSGDGTP